MPDRNLDPASHLAAEPWNGATEADEEDQILGDGDEQAAASGKSPRPSRSRLGDTPTHGSAPLASRASTQSELRVPRMRCNLCPLGEPGRCPKYGQDAECTYERRETFPELERPEDVPRIMQDLLGADLMSFFRAKRIEGMNWKGIDNDAVRLGQALHKGLETYLELRRQAAGEDASLNALAGEAARDVGAAIASSDGELFSEIADDSRRDRLVREYLELLRREREVLEEVGRGIRGEERGVAD